MNKGLPAFGIATVVDGEIQFDGDIEAIDGLSFEIRPVKVQAKTIFSAIAAMDCGDGEIVSDGDFAFGNGSVSDLAATLQEMNPGTREMAVNALAGANPNKYDGLLSFISTKIPGKVDFTVVE